jgi:hypothetical protein
MKPLYGCVAVASLLLWADHMAGAQESPPLPELISPELGDALRDIGEILSGREVKTLETVTVVGFTDKGEELMVTFAVKALQDAKAEAQDCMVAADAPDLRQPTHPDKGKWCDPRLPFSDPTACQPALPRLLAPICDNRGNVIRWYGGFTHNPTPPNPAHPYHVKYMGSPVTILDCGNKAGGTRPCK